MYVFVIHAYTYTHKERYWVRCVCICSSCFSSFASQQHGKLSRILNPMFKMKLKWQNDTWDCVNQTVANRLRKKKISSLVFLIVSLYVNWIWVWKTTAASHICFNLSSSDTILLLNVERLTGFNWTNRFN